MRTFSFARRPSLWVCVISLLVCYAVLLTGTTIPVAKGALETRPARPAARFSLKPPLTHTATRPPQRDGELLVRFRPFATESVISNLMAANGGQPLRPLRGESRLVLVRVPRGTEERALNGLRRSGLVEWVEPNALIAQEQITPNDPRFGEQWALNNTGANRGRLGSDLQVRQAWETTTGAAATVIAVIDSGIDFTHPELRANQWTNRTRPAREANTQSGGFVNDLHGWDFVADAPNPKDESGHGTAVAGLIAAEGNNRLGIAGVMWRAGLMDLRVLDGSGTGDVAAAIEAIDYATTHGAQVINLSWSTAYPSRALAEAIQRAARRGVVVVCAAGNQGADLAASLRYPAAFPHYNLLAVTATDEYDQPVSWSNSNSRGGILAAPGVNLLTTKPGGEYQPMSGTSGAAALVSGIVGLIRTVRPYLSAEQTKALLLQGSRRADGSPGYLARATGALTQLESLPASEGLSNTRNLNGGEHQPQAPPASAKAPDSAAATNAAQTPNVPGVGGPPRPGLPNLDVLRQQTPQPIRAFPHVPPPAWRHPRMPRAPRNGLRVGDPLPNPNPTPGATPSVTPTPLPSPSASALSSVQLSSPAGSDTWPGTDADGLAEPRKGGPSEPDGLNLWDSPTTGPGNTPASSSSLLAATATAPAAQPFGELSVEGWFIDFYQAALAQYPQSTEQDYWYDVMRKARETGGNSCASGQCVLASRDVGRTLFESPVYYARSRNNHWYVYDLYKAYLRREPDSGGWAFWESLVPTYGRDAVRRAFDESGEYIGIVEALAQEGSSSSNATNVWAAKQDLLNSTGGGGVDPVSRNFGWSLPLVGLPGRAGLDLGLTLAYNSAVWTKSGPYAYFDEENGFPGPGFRLGFPTIQNRYFNPQTGKNAYLLVTPGGARVELRQGAGNLYDAADSSYLQLADNGDSLLLRSTDGTQLSFSKINDEWRCTQIKDRNGNYLTITYQWWGNINTITDTLGRVLTFEYFSTNQSLYRITQNWGGNLRVYALFEYQTQSITSPFGSGVTAIGTGLGTTQANSWPMLQKMWLGDVSHFDFEYFASGQVSLIKHWASDGQTELGNTSLQMDGNTGYEDRINRVGVKAKNWNLVNNVPQDVFTYYDTPATATWNWTAPYGTAASGSGKKTRITLPDNTKQDVYFFDSGWKRGLVGYTETLITVNNVDTWQRRTGSLYTQDDTGLNYRLNPRVTESAVGDLTNNRRSKVTYTTTFGLPQDIEEYGINGLSVLRRTHIDYLAASMTSGGAYFDNRIIGLPEYSYLYDETNQLAAKTQLEYDTPANILALPNSATAIQHDASYTSNTKRGLVTKITRYKTSSESGDNSPATITNEVGYYVTGSAAFSRDALGHQSNISYADSFSDTGHPNTFAYPTSATDAAGYSATAKFNYYFGGVTRTEGPPPQNNPNGAIQTITYDGIGRVAQVTTDNTGAFTQFYYGPDYTQSWTTINSLTETAYSVQFVDGLGQVILAGSQHPGSVGQYKAQTTEYDKMGRAVRVSNPAEVNTNWSPAGEDASGWRYTSQTYDWKGRPRVRHFEWETGTDSDTELQYEGCGCAGGEMMTAIGANAPIAGTSPVQYGRRRERVSHDILGRTVKTEILNYNHTEANPNIYSATVTEYNARNQVRFVKQYAGAASGNNYQATETRYDGHGRPWKTHTPEMDDQKWQSIVYNNDDTAQFTTDPRGVVTNYTYNSRHLVTGVSYDKSAASNPDSIPAVPTAGFTYDAVGNRLSMADSNSTVNYQYDQLSRLTSETRTFNGLSGSFALSYEYTIGGQLKKITDPFATSISYAYDRTGRLTGVTGTGSEVEPTYISGIQYRAWGAAQRIDYGNTTYSITNYDAALRPSSFSMNNVRLTSLTQNSSATLTWTYNYNQDGKLQQALDSGDNRFDQRFEYDQMGRMKEAYSGREARYLPPDTPYYNEVPYRSSFTYNPFGQMTERTGKVYWHAQNDSGAYVNNRRTDYGYVYNEAGRLVEDQRKYTYDAANRHTRSVSWWQSDMAGDGSTQFPFQPKIDIAQTYDADGQTVKREQISRRNIYDLENPEQLVQVLEDGQTNYELRSSVLGGAVILRLALDWQQSVVATERNIYAGGTRIAKGRTYEHHNPVTGSWVTTNYNVAPY